MQHSKIGLSVSGLPQTSVIEIDCRHVSEESARKKQVWH